MESKTKKCTCCGCEMELKYFHRSYSVCKLCITKIKHEKYEQRKKKGEFPTFVKKGTKKDKIATLRKRLNHICEQARVLALNKKIDEYKNAMREYDKIYYQLENLKAI